MHKTTETKKIRRAIGTQFIIISNAIIFCTIILNAGLTHYVVLAHDNPKLILASEKTTNGYNLKCMVNNSWTQSAITWITPITEDYNNNNLDVTHFLDGKSKPICDFNVNDCNQYFHDLEKWQITDSFSTRLDAVTDYRWEDFPTLYTPDSKNQLLLVKNITGYNNFQIPFSLRTKYEGHIYLCDDVRVFKANCYEIVVGGARGTKNILRKKTYKYVHGRRRLSIPEERNIQVNAVLNNTNPLNQNLWSHFAIEKNENTIFLKDFNGNLLLNYTDNNDKIEIKHLLIYSLYSTGYWKIHNYKFISTNFTDIKLGPFNKQYSSENVFCFSMLVHMCSNCSLTLTLRTNFGVDVESRTYNYEARGWREIKFVTHLTNIIYDELFFIGHYDGKISHSNHVWAIDYVRKCKHNEMRISELNVKNTTNIFCEVLEEPNSKITVTAPIARYVHSYDVDFIDKNCPECQSIQRIIHDESSVTCCLNNYQRISCTCSASYTGNDCIEVFLPVFQNPPFIVKANPTTITVQMQNMLYYPEEINGTFTELLYKIQYKKQTESEWETHPSTFKLHQAPTVDIPSTVATKYLIRAILINEKNQSYSGDNVPSVTATTTCKMVAENDISLKQFYSSVQISFKATTESCTTENYRITVGDLKSEISSTPYLFIINNLNSTTNYTAIISCHNYSEKVILLNFTTTEREDLNLPENVEGYWDEFYNFTLKWNYPRTTTFTVNIEINNRTVKEEANNSFFKDSDHKFWYKHTIKTPITTASEFKVSIHTQRENHGTIERVYYSPPKTPMFNQTIQIDNKTNSIMTIKFPSVVNLDGERSILYIIVTDLNVWQPRKYVPRINKLWKYVDAPLDYFSWIAAEILLTNMANNSFETDFIITDKLYEGSLQFKDRAINKVLKEKNIYQLTLLLINEFHSLHRHNLSKYIIETPENVPFYTSVKIIYIIMTLIFLMICLTLIRYKCRRQQTSIEKVEYYDVITSSTSCYQESNEKYDSNSVKTTSTTYYERPMPIDNIEINWQKESMKPLMCTGNLDLPDRYSKVLRIDEFLQYVKTAIVDRELEKQFKLVAAKCSGLSLQGVKPVYKYPNYRSYNSEGYSYATLKIVEAYYIQGYCNPKAYIVTEDPDTSTVSDFWKMIWQQKIQLIVTLGDVFQGRKITNENYWPTEGEENKYHEVTVRYESQKIFDDFKFRTFSINCGHESRKVTQLHYLLWPNNDIPLNMHSLVPLIKEMFAEAEDTSPILIQCSSGIRYAGVIILSHMCFKMAAKERYIDILRHFYSLKKQYAEFIVNVEEYKIAHFILIQLINAPRLSFKYDETLHFTLTNLLLSGEIEHQLQHLKLMEWQDQRLKPNNTYDTIPFQGKDRFTSIRPDEYERIRLTPPFLSSEESDYINAVFVDGFQVPRKFIVTQQPLPTTVGDFWKMIYENNVNVIVSLNEINKNDKTSYQFWPDQQSTQMNPISFILLQHTNTVDKGVFNIITLTMFIVFETSQSTRTIEIIAAKEWRPLELLPASHEFLLTLFDAIADKCKPMVVTCYDGATASGLFVTLSFVMEKLKVRKECDVCLAVRSTRRNRNQLVTERDQFIFIYDTVRNCINKYNKNFEI